MFNKNKTYSLKDYQKQRKGKISLSGHSAIMDWFFVVTLGSVLIALIFYFSISEIRHTINFQPEPDQNLQNTINDEKVLKDLDEIIESYKNNEEEMIDEEVSE